MSIGLTIGSTKRQTPSSSRHRFLCVIRRREQRFPILCAPTQTTSAVQFLPLVSRRPLPSCRSSRARPAPTCLYFIIFGKRRNRVLGSTTALGSSHLTRRRRKGFCSS